MERYDKKVERHMKLFYDSLSEKDRRRYAALEVAKLGHGGVEYVAERNVIHRQYDKEVKASPNCPEMRHPIACKKKGGRKSCLDSIPELEKTSLGSSKMKRPAIRCVIR